MKRVILALSLAVCSTPAMANGACRYGTPGIFEFVKWSFKKTDEHWMEMTITVRHTLKIPLSRYEVQIEVDEHDFGFKSEVPIAPGGEATSKYEFGGMTQQAADAFAARVPTLCAIGVTDDKGNHTSYY